MVVKKIEDALNKQNGLVAFTVAGDPDFEKSADYIVALAEAGADVIEVGIAFSDPSADGPTIMAADIRAAEAGSTTERIFEMLSSVRERTDVPIALLTYTNPVYKYGYDAFFKRMQQLQIQGIIMPDLPLEEQGDVTPFLDQYDISLIQLVTLQSGARIKELAKVASGYIYMVSSLGITGARSEISDDANQLITEIKRYTDVPVAVGFGISKPEHMAQFSTANGVIIGSAIVEKIAQHPYDAEPYLTEFIQTMKLG